MKSICENPSVLEAMSIVNKLIGIIKVLVPAALIVISVFTLFKTVVDDKADVKEAVNLLISKFIIAAMIFLFPSFAGAIFNISFSSANFQSCFTNAVDSKIKELYLKDANSKVLAAESSNSANDIDSAYNAISKLDDSQAKTNLTVRVDRVNNTVKSKAAAQNEQLKKEEEKKNAKIKEEIEKELAKQNQASSTGTGTATASSSLGAASFYSNGKIVGNPNVRYESEPDPSAAINYWDAVRGYISASNYVYPKDNKTGKPLGAWPASYENIPTQITSYKTYNNGTLMFPVTPDNGTYKFVYNHRSIDIMAKFGTPIYSPADGQLEFSEWGHCKNQNGDETAYSVVIRLDTPFNVGGTKIDAIFLTHMSGIRYRCSHGTCNRHIQKGELLGFVGNAAGGGNGIWAPHLHMTFYTYPNTSTGLYTSPVENLYNLNPNGTKISAGS